MNNTKKSLLLIAFIAIAAGIYFLFDPSNSVWFPKCAFHMLTGLECPTCGSQRAVHAALHGNIMEALRINTFILIAIPYGLGLIVICLIRNRFTERLRSKLLHPTTVYIYCIIFVGWWIIRNLI